MIKNRGSRGLIAISASLALASCALPASGPGANAIASGASATLVAAPGVPGVQFALVDLTARASSGLPDTALGSFRGSFGASARRRSAPEVTIGVGDVVEVSIFESSKGGLFLPADAGSRPGNFVTLPRQTVGHNGTIKVPYAGQVRASGRSALSVQSDIESRLAQKAIEPQVVVSILTQSATEVAVLGDVPAANKLPLSPSGDRVMDMISRAGGIKGQGYETYVTLQRRGKSATVYFNRLVKNPAENIFVQPGDTIFVSREERSFIVFGAAGANGRFPFTSERVSIAEAIGQAKGLLDNRADPDRVYLYRMEERRILERLGLDLSAFAPDAKVIPTIYKASLRDPAAFFATQKVYMNDKDIVYIGNADSVEVIKLFSTVNAVVGPASNASGAALNIDRLN